MNVLVMNLEKLLELLFVLFAYCLQLLTGNGADRGSEGMLLNDQSVAT